jgi:hypothetical protein
MTQTTIDQTSGCPAEPRHVGWRPQLTQTMPARHWYTTAALQQPHLNIMGVSLQTVFQTILGRWQAIAALVLQDLAIPLFHTVCGSAELDHQATKL